MSERIRLVLRRSLARLRPVAWLLVLVPAYFVARFAFASAVAGSGLFSPAGLGNLTWVLLALVVMALRLVLLFAAPGILAYQLASRLLAAMSRPSAEPPARDGD